MRGKKITASVKRTAMVYRAAILGRRHAIAVTAAPGKMRKVTA